MHDHSFFQSTRETITTLPIISEIWDSAQRTCFHGVSANLHITLFGDLNSLLGRLKFSCVLQS